MNEDNTENGLQPNNKSHQNKPQQAHKETFPLIVILGPTAAGKTKLSIELTAAIDGEIISADSMQIYRGMDIGTAKADADIREKIPHHMIDIIAPDQKFSVADFQKQADQLIPNICRRNKMPFLVGGTGLYIKAVVEGFLLPEMEVDHKLREKLQQQAQEYSNKYVHNQLEEIDPKLAQKLHPNDLRRVIRGIEIYRQTGKTKTYYKKQQEKQPPRYYTLKIGLTREREQLYRRINQRVDHMINMGLIEEVKSLKKELDGFSETALQGLGYREINNYLEGKYDLEEAIRLIKRNTRHLAKKQLTWFKRDEDIHWFNLSRLDFKEVYEKSLSLIKKKLCTLHKEKFKSWQEFCL